MCILGVNDNKTLISAQMGLTVESRVTDLIQIIQKKISLDLNEMRLVYCNRDIK